METTLYDDESNIGARAMTSKDNITSMKRNMKLDLDLPPSFGGRPCSKKQKFNSLLSSPDLNMLKLGSPELERLIIAQNGLVTTTPTPTQYLFPRQATEEQEVYARGFTEALAELQTVEIPQVSAGNGHATSSSSAMLLDPSLSAASLVQQSQHHQMPPHFTTAHHHDTHLTSHHDDTSFSGAIASSSSSASNSPFVPVSIKDEPQTVPSMGNSPPMSPIDMENQERIKLERKRQRNRLAASKCRKRKLERIAKLEDKVRILKGENSDLANVVVSLKEQVCALKQEVIHHTRNGCQIMTTDIINTSTPSLM